MTHDSASVCTFLCANLSLPASSRQPCMSGSAFASTRAGKSKTVEEVSELLHKSNFIFSIPPSYMTGKEVVRLRMNMPEGCTARVVKNKLMRIAAKDTDFEKVSEITTGANFWMFVEGEDNLAAPIKYIQDFAKDMDPNEKVSTAESEYRLLRHLVCIFGRICVDTWKYPPPSPPPLS